VGVRYEREGAKARFGEHLNESARRLQQELHSLAEELYRVRSLFAVGDAVSRAGFRVFTEEALSMRPALRAFEWAPRVTDDRREAFESTARRDGSPRWRISVAAPGGELVPVPTKGEYFPVLYAEPLATNEGAIGFDLSSEPARRAALDAARETQGLGVTPPVDLVQEPRPSKALLFVLPVLGPATTSGRDARSSLHGFLVLVVRNPRVPEGVWLRVSGMPLRDEGGVLVGGVITYRDVTARRKAEDALRKSLHRLEELRYAVDQAAIVTVANPKGLIVYVNDRFCATSGFPREELLGQDCRIVDSGHHPREFFEEVGRTVASGSVWQGLVCGRAKSGTHFWLATTIVPLREESGRPRRHMAISTEVTESLRQAETLRRLSNAVEQTADSVFITDREGVIEYVNPAFEATTGYSREEALGKTPRILKSGRHDRAHYEELWKTILAGEVHRSTGVNRKKSGELYYSEQTITPMRDGEGRITHFVAVVKDVTDRIDRQAREIEMEYAARVQRRLYPERPPEIDGLDLSGSVFPAVKVGGDYFDFVTLPGSGLLVAVGDVCGHGLGSALIMAETRAYLRSLAPSCADPGVIAGDLFVLLTDGITEAESPDGTTFGAERALEVVRAHRHQPARGIVGHLRQAILAFSGGAPARDDLTVVVGKLAL
jgi:PAS domain S-box-containing protein